MALKVQGITNTRVTHRYVPIEYRNETNAPVFDLKTLSVRQLAELDDALTKVDGAGLISLATGSHALKALKMSLVGWENIVDEDDKPVEFKKGTDGAVSDDMLEMLPAHIRAELSGFAINASRFPETAQEMLGK